MASEIKTVDDELVDVVDENGYRQDTISKHEAHEKGLLHQCVVSEVIDSQGRWLLVKQASDRQDAGQYVSPIGGHVSAGESREDALIREAKEELGLADFSFEPTGETIYNRHVLNRQENHLFILYAIHSDAKPVLNHESESFRYFTESELRAAIQEHPEQFGDAFHFVIKSFFPKFLPNLNLRAIKMYDMKMEADLAAGQLQEHDIKAIVQSDRTSIYAGTMSRIAGFKVIVPEKDAKQALELLE